MTRTVRRLVRLPLPLAVLLVLGLAAVAGPWLWQQAFGITFDAQALEHDLCPPSWRHPFGTDFFGRDIFVRVLCGLRMSFAIGLCGATVAVGLGTAVGLAAGTVGGALDQWLMRAVDVLYAVPFLFVAVLLVTLFGKEPLLVFVALGAVGWLPCARMVRAHVLAERALPYVDALQNLGASRTRVALVHLLPNSTGIIATAFGISVPVMVLEEAFLSFLGLGVQPPHASLGSLVADGATVLRLSPWPLVSASVTTAALLWALQALAEALERGARSR